MNKVMLVGRLGADPEVRATQGGTSVVDLRLATSERRKSGDQWTDHTEWHTVTVWGRRAETCGQYLRKGSQVGVEGRLQTDTVERDGERRYYTKVVADSVEFLGGRSDGQSQNAAPQQPSGHGGYGQPAGNTSWGNGDDNLPF